MTDRETIKISDEYLKTRNQYKFNPPDLTGLGRNIAAILAIILFIALLF